MLDRVDFPFSHDLRVIRNLLPDAWPTEVRSADLVQLTVWGAEARYPGDWDEPTVEDAVRAEAEARLVFDSIAEEFGRRGVTVE